MDPMSGGQMMGRNEIYLRMNIRTVGPCLTHLDDECYLGFKSSDSVSFKENDETS